MWKTRKTGIKNGLDLEGKPVSLPFQMRSDDLAGIIKKIIRALEGRLEVYAMGKNVLSIIEHRAGYVQ